MRFKKTLVVQDSVNKFHFLFHFPFPSKEGWQSLRFVGWAHKSIESVSRCAGCAPPGVTFVAVPFPIFFCSFIFCLLLLPAPGRSKLLLTERNSSSGTHVRTHDDDDDGDKGGKQMCNKSIVLTGDSVAVSLGWGCWWGFQVI